MSPPDKSTPGKRTISESAPGRLAVEARTAPGDAALTELLTTDVVAVGIPVYESESGPSPLVSDPGSLFASGSSSRSDGSSLWLDLAARQGFSAKAGQTLVVHGGPHGASAVFLGCGHAGSVGLDELRRVAAALVRAAGRVGEASILLPASLAESATRTSDHHRAHREAAQAFALGAVLASYRFSAHKKDEGDPTVQRLFVVGIDVDEADVQSGVERGVRIASAVCLARDMINEPPSSMTPSKMAELAESLGGPGNRTKVEVWDAERIAGEHLGGLLGVARGSAEQPRLVRVDYDPADPLESDGHVPYVVLVGKGITFDSGGLSLKTADGMLTMKTDMSGAAAVLATVFSCSDLGVRVRVTAIAPLTENMPGGKATKPGDVLRIRDGQTIEVLNTDAEGRLILADGLSLASELRPDAIIDLATLTGAAVVSLGRAIAAVFSNDDALARRIEAAAKSAGESTWRLPLPSQYKSHVESEVADMKNTGKPGQAGSIIAALILERFVKNVPWAHIDMAGPARSDQDDGLLTKGGTGFGVQTLLELLSSYD